MLRRDAATRLAKAELRVVGEDAVRKHIPDPKGEWVIMCECGHQATVRIAFSVALDSALECPNCGRGRWLTEEHLRPPWEEKA
jgi:hypothetical protein